MIGKKYEEVWLREGSAHEVNEREGFFENLNVDSKLIADLGAGTLRFSLEAIRKGCREAVGLDLYRGLLKWGLKKAKEQKMDERVSVIVADVRYLPLRSNVFDAVAAIAVFEHIPKGQILFLNEVYRVLKPSGTAVIDTWNAIPVMVGRLLRLTKDEIERWKKPFYYRNYYPWEFKQLLISCKFKSIRIVGAHNTYFTTFMKKKLHSINLRKASRLLLLSEIIVDKIFRRFVPLNWITGRFLIAILKKK
ncbi:MAG: class I SAM-dependent methyltransferase [Promethearchaeota archaeon]